MPQLLPLPNYIHTRAEYNTLLDTHKKNGGGVSDRDEKRSKTYFKA